MRARRNIVWRVTTGIAGLALVNAGCTAVEATEELSFTIGRQPYAAGNSPITQYMMEHELVEKAAADLGQDVEITYLDYPSAAPQVAAMISDRLDFGMWGNTPIISAIAMNQPLSVISTGEGNLRFVLLTDEDAGIHNMEDLKGKRVGLLVGGDPHLAFIGMLKQELGVADPAEAGINLVNLPTQAISATVPKGVDATIVGYPSVLKQQETDDSVVGVLNSHGYTEPGYLGDAGDGEGVQLPSADESPFAPEGFYGHRSFWVARDEVIKDHPEVVQAFLIAEQQALNELRSQNPEEISDSVSQYWDLDPENGVRVLDDEIVLERGWIWPTEGDAQLLMELSILMAQNDLIEEPLAWPDIVDGFRPSAELARRAYESTGDYPPDAEFESTPSDARGAPQWLYDSWTPPS